MNTRRITIDLPEESYGILRRSIEEGVFENEDEAVSALLTNLLFEAIPEPAEDGEYAKSLNDEIDAAVAEHEANPDHVYTEEEVRLYLAEQRSLREKGTHAETARLFSKSA